MERLYLAYLPVYLTSRIPDCSEISLPCMKYIVHWRDSVMIAGLAVAITGIVMAILTGSSFFTVSFCICAGTIGFGAHFVRLYIELKNLREQLITLTTEVTTLKNLNDSIKIEFDNFKIANVRLAEISSTLELRLKFLNETSKQLDEKQALLGTTVTKQAEIQELIFTETSRLKEIREDLTIQIGALREVSTELVENSAVQTRISAFALSLLALKQPREQ